MKDAVPSLPTMRAERLRGRPELWDRYVPDAHVLQLLTARHLELVADLSGWRVTEVADDGAVALTDRFARLDRHSAHDQIAAASSVNAVATRKCRTVSIPSS